ncbi:MULTISPECIES: FAD-binding oxidoreductase [Burkholderia]|uniref:FAD-dependent oxidoreductase n=1 Tax=Burkholderia aenigmatica TaxID=2015348 RepID=A0A228HQ66_9BURK|nr:MULTISPECIES: FAD-binding oxidoreductase [Burkholderia]MBN3838244.1 FAD-binding oxidoreductase [Burkholderia sp. Ac-20349]OXI32049.1 FAD-dependent oxidoreductase [Burkholderia aenigmatica]
MRRVNHLPADDASCGWFHLSRQRQPAASHAGKTSARWVVVGAGLTGLAAARRIAQHYPDDPVVLLEAQEVGYGASGRNSGFAIDLPHDIGASDYIGDPATARMSLKLNQAAQSILKGLVAEHGIDCDMRPVGKYQAAVEPRGIAVLDAYRRGLDKLGEHSEVLSEAELPERIGTHFYKKGLFTPGTILLQPAALVKGLADSLPENVTLHEHTPISAVDYGSRITLAHAHGEIVADKLLLTNNAFASSFGFLKRRLLPVFTYASITRVLTDEEQTRLGGAPVWGIIPADPFGSTLRRTPDNRLLVRNSFSFNPDGRSNERFLQRVRHRHRASFERRFPMLPNVEFDYTWGGAMCLSRNHLAHFGLLAPNVYGALCCGGLGITRGTITGTLLADWLAGERNELIEFLLSSPGPNLNPPEPFLSIGANLNLMWGQCRAGKES